LYLPHAELMANGAIRAGTLYTDCSLGINFRAGWMNPYFNNLGIERNGGRKFQLYVFFRAHARAVGYNATMQGGLFHTNSIFTIPDKD
ncbi:lipid A deacylase LpxR family protein, partial [Salmonella enterica subsp. enterica serovar Typhimurium]|nr:lipid A deacylase LpxR family protein [Salmonella enterica subsp. enterica serovar Typhimurium]